MPLTIGTRLGPYDILSAIGAGGMGEVYRAHDTRLNRDVALKVLPEAFSRDGQRMARFDREAKVLASLNHTNIAAIYGIEESGLIKALVMELVEGPTLAERVKVGAIPLDEALPIARQVADAVEYAHDTNVIHRDLKPANIKVTAEGTVKVLDFGLAKALSDEPTQEDMSNSPTLSMAATRAGMILGTAAYMSPEQAKGKVVDRRADVWAFGAVLYEMLTGKQAFTGEDVTEILVSVMSKEPAFDTLPASTPPAIRNLLRRCLDRNIKRRLQSAGEARIILEDVLSGAVPGADAAEAIPVAPCSSRATWIATGAAAALLLALGALSFVHFRETPPAARPARFFVGPPEKTVFYSAPQVVTVSPDGTRLAFLAGTASAPELAIWVRPLDSLTAQLLPGTTGAGQPFWSWDSRYIAFFADGKLKKIDVSGGPPQVLCDSPNVQSGSGGHGSWNRDGVILFPHGGGGSAIFRVSAAGSAATAVTTLDSASGETEHLWPHFLPDGDHFVFLALNRDVGKSTIRIGSLKSKETRFLLNAESFAMYAPPGYLLYQRDGTLMAQPFDASALAFTGDAFPIVEQVQVNISNGRVAFDVSRNGVLAYRSTGAFHTQLTWFDRSGKELGRIGETGAYSSPALSPDGKRVAMFRNGPAVGSAGSTGDVWIADLTRNAQTRLTFDTAFHMNPVWSPDGARIAFNSTRNGVSGLYVKNSNSAGEEELLVKASQTAAPEHWSLDGRFLIYGDATDLGRDEFLLPLAGDPSTSSGQAPSAGSGQVGKPVPFAKSSYAEMHGQFSPDGRWLAYLSNESGRPEIYVRSFPSGEGEWQISTGGGVQPRWRRDGKELYFIALDGKLMAVSIASGATFSAGTPQTLFQTRIYGLIPSNYYTQQYDVTPDGQRFLINVDATDTNAAPLTVVLDWTAGLKK